VPSGRVRVLRKTEWSLLPFGTESSARIGRGDHSSGPVGLLVDWHARDMRVTIRVRPGAGRTSVGGAHDGAVVVRVRERAVEGKATSAALAALATALGVRRGDVTLVTGSRSRTKVVEVPDSAAERLRELRDGA
jgi:uncharacterized protein YggU (UPF0235/DUF167 family)